MNVQGKKVLITGGSSGIGLAVATELVRKGARVFIVGRRAGVVGEAIELLRAAGGQADGTDADVGTTEGRDRALATARASMGGVDILINSAGGVRAGRLEDRSEEHTSELQSLMRISYAVFCLKKKKKKLQ